jgi:hypothetical protein
LQLPVLLQASKAQAKTKRKSNDSGFSTAMHEKVDRLFAQDLNGVMYPPPGKKKVKIQSEDTSKFWSAAHEAVKASLHKDFPDMSMTQIDGLIRG